MLPAYRTHFETLTAATEALLAAVAALPHPSARPADGGWSGTQVVRHLLGAETSITQLLEKQAAKPAAELPTAGLKSWFRARLMSWMLARPNGRFKVPARLGEPLGEPVDHGAPPARQAAGRFSGFPRLPGRVRAPARRLAHDGPDPVFYDGPRAPPPAADSTATGKGLR